MDSIASEDHMIWGWPGVRIHAVTDQGSYSFTAKLSATYFNVTDPPRWVKSECRGRCDALKKPQFLMAMNGNVDVSKWLKKIVRQDGKN